METLPIKIYDETLRDGEQQAGLFFSYPTKQKLAHLIAQTGVDGIDIMPCVCEQEAELAITGATLVYKAIAAVTDYIEQLGVRPAAPYSKTAQRHETGTHVRGIGVMGEWGL